MSNSSNVPEADVLVLRPGPLDANLAQGFAAQRFAELTHLPAGATSSLLQTVTVPVGGKFTGRPAGTEPALLHVVAGQVKVSWGGEPGHSAMAAQGDTLLVPPGTDFQALNVSVVESLQFILVSGT